MAVLLTILIFAIFIGIEFLMRPEVPREVPRGMMYTTPGFEYLGALAQDGGELKKEDNAKESTDTR